jgi:hypothetical protein
VSPFRPPISPQLSVYPNSPRALSPLSTAFLSRARSRRTPIRAVSPLFVVFTPNPSLTPLSTAFTQTHRGVGVTSPAFGSGASQACPVPDGVANHKSRIFIRLRALELSCCSFCSSDPLFSTACTLFCKIPGVWVSRTVLRDTRASGTLLSSVVTNRGLLVQNSVASLSLWRFNFFACGSGEGS